MYVFVTLLCAKYVRLLSIRAFSSRRLASWQLGVSFPFFVALIQFNCPAFRPPNPPPSSWGSVSGSLKQLPEWSPACYSLKTIGGVRLIPKFYLLRTLHLDLETLAGNFEGDFGDQKS